jgi:7,8-dihydro-6-hydroxymethylpterin dimethyltransferase
VACHEVVLSHTESVCPECLARIPAMRVADGDRVLLKKRCPEHGPFEAVIWRGEPVYSSWSRPKTPSHPKAPQTAVESGCPWDCGLCPEHRQQTCCTLLEVTQRCDLKCPVCFANAGNDGSHDPDLHQVRRMYEALLAAGGPYNVQLSGGEPTVRDDLPEVVSLGRAMGFDFIQLNSNGLRLAREPEYVKKLKAAGLSCVFLQFDGLEDEIHVKLRGMPLSQEKERAVAHCREHELGVILVPTLVPDVNVHQIGPIIDYAVNRLPGVRGVHFQPVSYLGRYSGLSQEQRRLTIPEIITEIEKQTNGLIKTEHFRPPGAEHSHCSFHGNFVLMPEGELRPWTVHNRGSSCCGGENGGLGAVKAQQFQKQFWTSPAPSCCSLEKGPSLGGWDLFLERLRTHSFCLSGMAFQDAWTLDLERLKECHLHVLHPDGRLVPFCAYNLTDSRGRSVYRHGFRPGGAGQDTGYHDSPDTVP